jgi:RNase P/RNase MRP subunit POP5
MVIKKTLRKGKRYILFKQHYKNKPLKENEIVQELKRYIGLIDMPPIKIIYYDNEHGIIKTDDSGLKKIIIGLILCSDNEGRIEVLDSSGTIKSIIERNPELKNKVKKN